MGKRKIEIRMVLCICAALGWWGMLYPELTMLPDTYAIVYEQKQTKEVTQNKMSEQNGQREDSELLEKKNLAETSEGIVEENFVENADNIEQYAVETVQWDFDSDIYQKVLNAEKGQVKFQSRFLKELKTLFEKIQQ